ncbi:phosphotransferase family protein [Nocardioides sp. GXZ039]|uniref:phosphotransferase family protein n=1 Tax=Nocardioides sp. GXZ039 TaxID=3136018 RepID=UPI0030F42914
MSAESEYLSAIEWAGTQAGPVTSVHRLTGGLTSTMLALQHADGTETVLRLIDREPWRTHGVELATREHETQLVLADTPVPAPASLALDAVGGSSGGVAAHLMTRLPGATDQDRVDDGSLGLLAATLAAIHDVRPSTPARPYQSWAWEAKYVVPDWAREPQAWEAAFALLRTPPPDGERTFIHRDFQPRNVLWLGAGLTGVVDWVETSTGPPWLDVAHCATNLAIRHGTERAAAFAAAYSALTGRVGEAYWDVMDIVGFLPPPGRRGLLTDPVELDRLESQLVARLGEL